MKTDILNPTLLTPENVAWLFNQAIEAQGHLPPDECDSNRKELEQMYAQFNAVLERERVGAERDALAVNQFLTSIGLQVIK